MTTALTAVSEVASKATREVVEAVKRFAEVKKSITTLEAEKKALDAVITEAFGTADLLTHHGVEVARRDWRNRSSFDEKAFVEALTATYPDLVSAIVPLIEQSKKQTKFSVIVNLFR